MQSNNTQKAMDRVVSFCEGIVRLNGSPSDDEIHTCERILSIIKYELEEKIIKKIDQLVRT